MMSLLATWKTEIPVVLIRGLVYLSVLAQYTRRLNNYHVITQLDVFVDVVRRQGWW